VYDVVIRGGTVYGAGAEPIRADVAIAADRVVAVGPLSQVDSVEELDATGKVVAPGFINVLSHSYFTMLHDGRSLGELTQGVTTQVFGEGGSMGPLTPAMQAALAQTHRELDLEVTWSRLSEFLALLERRGCSQNVASFVGNGTLRPFVLGYENRSPTSAELDQMRSLVAEEMADGALGLASALIYPPESYASTDELVALCTTVASYGGMYISHLRDEGTRLLAAVDELIHISQEAGLAAEIFHLKASGRANWDTMPRVLERIEEVRADGLAITADVYPYIASSTGLTTAIPDRFHEGGAEALYDRLDDDVSRAAIRQALLDAGKWGDAESADEVLILGVRSPELRGYQGMTLRAVSEERRTDPIDTVLDLIRTDRTRVTVAFFTMSEHNLREELRRSWVGIGSDGSSMAPEGISLRAPTHPRAYGTFARVFGTYVRDEAVLTLAEAIDKLTRLPAATLGLTGRGSLAVGSYADAVVFDPDRVRDRATFTEPHRLAVGIDDVVVNGRVALRGGQFTGVLAGRALRR
ncbi:MAG: N-acyl-D-amino-acid deacylase family protein, partial [Nocardioidaceae bacterium]